MRLPALSLVLPALLAALVAGGLRADSKSLAEREGRVMDQWEEMLLLETFQYLRLPSPGGSPGRAGHEAPELQFPRFPRPMCVPGKGLSHDHEEHAGAP
jgi:hypothetical protein